MSNFLVIPLCFFFLVAFLLTLIGYRRRSRKLKEETALFESRIFELTQTVNNLEQKAAGLKEIINTIQEGVIVLDKEGKVVLTNDEFGKMVGAGSLTGRFYWEVIREAGLAKMVQELKKTNPFTTGEIQLGGKTFFCFGNYSSLNDYRTFTFRDITEIVRAEKLKNDFLLNVAHELRTPLTAIKGYIETLAETIDAGNRRYLNVISHHTERLTKLVEDLLDLARLEDKSRVPRFEEVDIRMLLTDVASIFERPAQEKGLALILELPDELPIIKGQPRQLEQAFINLLDNAIKYTERGSVVITAKRVDSQVAITIQDTGIGINEEHLPRIFERFYVVDKSRARQSGGAGLGLAIAKGIIELHNGRIEVVSAPGVGSKFTVILPIK